MTALLTRRFRRVVIVGAGLGGLSAACHLSGAGHRVTVIEQEEQPGGRVGRIERGGFTFDTGPMVLTMPDLLEATFQGAGVRMSELLTLRPLDPTYRVCFAGGSVLHVRHDRQAMVDEIRQVCGPADAKGYVKFCAWLESLCRLEMSAFIDRNYDGPADLTKSFAAVVQLYRLGGFRKFDTAVRRYFSDERLVRLFTFRSLYAGLAPQDAPAALAVMAALDVVRGAYVPEGGVGTVPSALAKAAEKAGATFRYGTRVQRVLYGSRGAANGLSEGGRIRGVRLADGSELPADAVVVNADVPLAYRDLLPDLPPPASVRRPRYAPSAFVWHLGVRGTPPADVAQHNLHLGGGSQWHKSIRTLLSRGRRMPDPAVLVSVPTHNDPNLAPAGSSVLSVLEPVPNLSGRVDWTRERQQAHDRLATLIDSWGYPTEVEAEEMVDPTDWAKQGLAMGTPFSVAHTLLQSGPFRPANVEPRVPGLVFVGSGTVPGVGVPMVLVSGRLAAERVESM